MNRSFAELYAVLNRRGARALVIGVYGANLYGPGGQALFATRDADLLLPLDAENLVRTWSACDECELDCWSAGEPLDRPRDTWLASRVIERRASTRVTGLTSGDVDLNLVMAGFDFETVWESRREFIVDGVPIMVARLEHIVASKHAAGRDKDRLFLAAHRDALEQLLKRQE